MSTTHTNPSLEPRDDARLGRLGTAGAFALGAPASG